MSNYIYILILLIVSYLLKPSPVVTTTQAAAPAEIIKENTGQRGHQEGHNH